MSKGKGEETKRKESFYTKKSEIKSVFYSNKPMFVLLYKEKLLNINCKTPKNLKFSKSKNNNNNNNNNDNNNNNKLLKWFMKT